MSIAAITVRSLLVALIVASAAAAEGALPDGAAVSVAVVGGLMAGACWFAGRARTGDLLALATAAWLLPAWAGIEGLPPSLRAIAMTGAIVSLPLLLHAMIGPRREIVALYAPAAGLVAVRILWFDPFLDVRCSVDCSSSPLAVAAGAQSEAVVRALDAWVPVGIAAIGVLFARRGARRSVVLAALGVLAAITARALAVRLESTDALSLPWNRNALLISAAATAAALAVASWPAIRTLQARRAVARIVRRLGDLRKTGDVENALAAATGNPRLRIAYRSSSGWIDARGNAVDPPPPGATDVRMDGETIAAVSGLGDDRQIGPTLRLGIANERLRAGVLARIADVRASRERVVVAGDAERRLLERNLHDGAQQRLLALSFELRRARSRAAGAEADELDRAIAETDLALAELRDLAHGIFPAILSEAGLDTALHALADAARIPVVVTCAVQERLPLQVEMAAYRVAAEAIEHAEASGTVSEMEIAVESADDLVVRVSHDGTAVTPIGADELGDAADRVAALDGTLSVQQGPDPRTDLVAVIPCAS